MEWKCRHNYMVSGDFKIKENVFWGSGGKHKNYSLYRKDEFIKSGNFQELKKHAELILKTKSK